MAGIFKIDISRNTKCDILFGFPKSGHICKYQNSNKYPVKSNIYYSPVISENIMLCYHNFMYFAKIAIGYVACNIQH